MNASICAVAIATAVCSYVRKSNQDYRTGVTARRQIRNTRLNNKYLIVRHGQSKANVAGVICSDPVAGAKSEFALTPLGKQQAARAGERLKKWLASTRNGVATHERVRVYCSDFSRALETADIICGELFRDVDLSIPCIAWPTVAKELRERYFGELDGQSSKRYQDVWNHDIKSVAHRVYCCESVASVLQRTSDLILKCESEFSGHVIVFVAHGDVNQILRTGFRTHITPSQHRSDEHLNPASVRILDDVVEVTDPAVLALYSD